MTIRAETRVTYSAETNKGDGYERSRQAPAFFAGAAARIPARHPALASNIYRDHYDDIEPRLPRLIYQGASKFVLREDGERYKRTLLRSAGMPMRGRPRKVPQPTAD